MNFSYCIFNELLPGCHVIKKAVVKDKITDTSAGCVGRNVPIYCAKLLIGTKVSVNRSLTVFLRTQLSYCKIKLYCVRALPCPYTCLYVLTASKPIRSQNSFRISISCI